MARPTLSLKARALKYLSTREHSRRELARKLSRYAQEGEDIEALLDFLEASKFLSEERFSESLVHRRATRFGNSRIIAELQSHGIETDAVNDLKHSLDESEAERARLVWRKKFAQLPSDAAERARQMRFLQQRGFSHRTIQAVLSSSPDDEE